MGNVVPGSSFATAQRSATGGAIPIVVIVAYAVIIGVMVASAVGFGLKTFSMGTAAFFAMSPPIGACANKTAFTAVPFGPSCYIFYGCGYRLHYQHDPQGLVGTTTV